MSSNKFQKKNIIRKVPKTAEVIPQNIITNEYKLGICSQSYLGKKGYTIPKSILSKEDEEFLRKDLFVKPMILGVNYGGGKDETCEFPVFRENNNKIYIPRFYGIQRYGMPNKSEIQQGDDIVLEFAKPLRDYQEKIIDIYTSYVNTPICIDSPDNGGGGILEVPCGRGKCLGKDTKILMYNGYIKPVQDIIIGDVLMGDDSTPRKVLSLARGRENMYKVSSENGESYIVNESHILSLKASKDIEKIASKGSVVDISVLDYVKFLESIGEKEDSLFGYRVPIHFNEKDVEIEPYKVGYWIGDDNPLVDIIINIHLYKCNSRKVRLELFAGFIDAKGDYYDNYYQINHNNEKKIDDIIFVARSLGFVVLKKVNKIEIHGSGLEEIPVKCSQKKAKKCEISNEESLMYRIKIEKLTEDEYYGFEIDGNHRFVLDDFTVTHNTVMALKIISKIQKKTLIIVHKEFLMNQWIERIEEFLPGARVGKIQAQVFDVNNKDIVIGMIQTLYDKEYPADTFSCFGLTIIDEVHRIGSEQFSKTLFKTITPYMLGISATVDRKDKLTRVLYMFIGDKIYSEKREDDDLVTVRSIEYKSDDPVFNEVEYDFRGNPKYSTMITKLCDYNRRSDFIVRVIGDLIREEPDNQIMVLCHNRSLLKYLYEAICYKNITSVGYYVGGMKQEKLQETEKKNIVLATYAMAAEALDIKTLSTLVMVTPKTDITQSVGRILRVKHEKPIIVDIVDTHDIFQNQWAQRRRFYKKCNYRILQIDSKNYTNMMLDWKEDKTWKVVYQPKQLQGVCSGENLSEDENENKTHAKYSGNGNGTCLISSSIFDVMNDT
jgi:superfamily II DNA or RNA helicase